MIWKLDFLSSDWNNKGSDLFSTQILNAIKVLTTPIVFLKCFNSSSNKYVHVHQIFFGEKTLLKLSGDQLDKLQLSMKNQTSLGEFF